MQNSKFGGFVKTLTSTGDWVLSEQFSSGKTQVGQFAFNILTAISMKNIYKKKLFWLSFRIV